ncbi:hypothetical protein HJG60_011161 [Phyllostomus discolor]|uniref:Uncharacterized protein n=1 Tax=Phyllostomus discolor TaxID=89673 RepID=A0A834A3X4_9CHIR|nr:hypothetical protein HJG60_011161 [Phyllostomus discolor]
MCYSRERISEATHISSRWMVLEPRSGEGRWACFSSRPGQRSAEPTALVLPCLGNSGVWWGHVLVPAEFRALLRVRKNLTVVWDPGQIPLKTEGRLTPPAPRAVWTWAFPLLTPTQPLLIWVLKS